jgi:type III pantothenate kinase
MILEMDCGNTRIKWRLREGNEIIKRGAIIRDADLKEIGDCLEPYVSQISKVQVASVLGERVKLQIQAWVKKIFNLDAVFAQPQPEKAGVQNGYDEPQCLGVDRWLAIIAAFNYCHSACVVISCGTAVTVDLVDSEGKHAGGYIVPGWQTAMSSLNQGTELIRLKELGDGSLQPGRYTQAAVHNGLMASFLGLIHNAIDQLKAQTKQDSVTILMTGGDAGRLKAYFPDSILCEELILDGLSFCLA